MARITTPTNKMRANQKNKIGEVMASATGELWAGSQAVMSTATQHAKIESKMLNAHSNEDDEYDEFDEYDDVLVTAPRSGARTHGAQARQGQT